MNITHGAYMHTKEPQPRYFVNVWIDGDGKEFCEGALHTTREAAILDAEEESSVCSYAFTLTDIGRINLEPEFSEHYQEAKADAYSKARNESLRVSA